MTQQDGNRDEEEQGAPTTSTGGQGTSGGELHAARWLDGWLEAVNPTGSTHVVVCCITSHILRIAMGDSAYDRTTGAVESHHDK
jgi:hypothetical protein